MVTSRPEAIDSLDREADQVVLQALRQRIGLRTLATRPGAGALQQQRHAEIVLREPRARERVAVDHAPVEADVVEVEAFEVEIDAGLAAHEP